MDILEIRKKFPILEKTHNDKAIIYLDSAATTQNPESVTKKVCEYYNNYNANAHRGSHYLGYMSTLFYEKTRENVAKFIGAKNSDEIVFTKNTTESINLIAYSYAMHNLKKGDEILITILEHHANLIPWQIVAKHTGCTLRYVYLNDDLTLNMDDFYEKLNENTKIVALTASSNVTGEIIDVKTITQKAHEKGAIVVVDCAQLISHRRVNVSDLDCDFLAFSAHKMYSTLGVGVLYGKYELLDKMHVFNVGGEMIEYVRQQDSTFLKPPLKFEAGTQNVAGVVALNSAIEFIEEIGYEEISNYENELLEYAHDRISDVKNLDIYSPCIKGKSAALISFAFKDIHAHDVASILDSYNIAVRSGHHCTMPLHNYLNVSATCRASFAIYNTKDEIDAFIEGLIKLRKVMGL